MASKTEAAGTGLKKNPVLMRRLSETKRAETVESPKKRSCVQWDEDNLRVNEEIKAELDCEKIDEPDTPFVRSPQRDEESDEEEGDGNHSIVTGAVARVEKLLLEQKASEDTAAASEEDISSAGRGLRFGPAPGQADAVAGPAEDEDLAHPGGFGSHFSYEEPTTSSAAQEGETHQSSEESAGREHHVEHEHDHDHDWEQKAMATGNRRMSNGEPYDLPSLSPTSGGFADIPETVFEAKRKQHYDVRNALAMGRHLLEEEDEEDEEEELDGLPPL